MEFNEQVSALLNKFKPKTAQIKEKIGTINEEENERVQNLDNVLRYILGSTRGKVTITIVGR